MKTNRRAFIGQLGLSALASQALAKQVKLNGEDFWEELRKEFPLTTNRAYLNNGTFGPSPTAVVEAVKKSLDMCNTSGEYGHTDESRATLAHFIGAKKEEISLTHNTTEGINIICWGLNLKQGDEVIISLHEHVGNALPWLNRAKLHGLKLVTFEPAPTADGNIERIKKLITPRTKVIAIPHITCTTGLVFPIKEIATEARKHGIFTAIDGAHGSGTFDLDVKELGIDSYATSCHKWMLGPNGAGYLYINEKHLPNIQAYQVGAYSDNGWDLYSNPPKIKAYNPTAHRFDYGSQSTPLFHGGAVSAEFHEKIGKPKVEARIRELSNHLYAGLAEMKSHLEILSPKEEESRICMVTFKPKFKDYKTFAKNVSSEGFRIRQVPESHLDAIRISTHIYNSKAEIERFLSVTEKYV